ncbi:MAG TPA: acyl-CoA dehydrogenase family protein [Tepidisphaeraceae bacterium]|jgi:alkylation response protein AidB-like acyl-CoA dehydrogenase
MDAGHERLAKVLPAIAARATLLDRTGDWPAEDLRDLGNAGAWRWYVPKQFGGEEIDPLALHLRYEEIASASVSTALIVSQRDSAIGLIDGTENPTLRQEILPALARGEYFATIGIAQLTTSQQGGLRAVEDGDGYRLDGVIPWSTGAAKAKYVIAGAITADRSQILFVLPTDLPGVTIQTPLELVALRSSWTSRIELHDAQLDKRWLLRGPVAKALSGPSRGIPLSQVFLCFGLIRAALDLITRHDSDRAKSLAARFGEQYSSLHTQVLELCQAGREADAAVAGPELRAACNDLAMRITQAAVALHKGSALLADHPAQRLAREAMFFLVWSCPDPVVDCTVNVLANRTPGNDRTPGNR